jgi:alkanesulfonate monooxygenase SsuD/methylene tetrahydromethanopterin reductase-like flavin-dependent oxidoreductase (luciferase family)
MKFGIGLAVQHRPEESQVTRFAEHLAQVRAAREVGFDSIWASQHLLSSPFTYFQPIPVLARVAAEAGSMTLGTGILLLPLFQPVDVAEQLATLDVICEGRLVVGVGLGYRDVENHALQVDPRERVGRLEEALPLLERLWSGEPVSHEGRYFTLRDVRISMPTVQRPRPPLWMAANMDAGVKRAARLADAWYMNPHATVATQVRQLALFHATRKALGRPPATEVPMATECYVAPDARTAWAEAGPFIEAKYAAYRSWEQDKALPAGEEWSTRLEELARDRFIVGDPAQVRDEIVRRRAALGLTHLVFRVQWPGMDAARVLRTIRLLGEQVLPHCR